jgi:hypothetical protein
MLNATRDLVLPTTITGSYPRPHWFTQELRGRGFKDALGDSRFREQYLDAVACLTREQPRRIAFYKCVAINLGANIVRRELKLPEVEIPAADPRWTFAS